MIWSPAHQEVQLQFRNKMIVVLANWYKRTRIGLEVEGIFSEMAHEN